MILTTRVIISLFAVALVAAVSVPNVALSQGSDRDVGGKRSSLSGEGDISAFEIVINITEKTNLEIKDAKRFMRDKAVFHQAANLHLPNGPLVGQLSIERSTIYGFSNDNRNPWRSNKGLKRAVKEIFGDPKIDKIEKIKTKNGSGRIAYFTMNGTLCMYGAVGYSFLNLDDGAYERLDDTAVSIAYCDPFGRTDQIIRFLKEAKLVTPADNRAAYALRESGKRSPTTVTSSESDEEIEARVSQVRAFQKKGLISEQEADAKIRKIRAE